MARLTKKDLDKIVALHPDSGHITATTTPNGQGYHLRWNYETYSLTSQDDDGDSVMGDATDDAYGSDDDDDTMDEDQDMAVKGETDSEMDAEGETDDETAMSDDEDERPRTPTPFGRFDPGSVILTPNKNKLHGAVPATHRPNAGIDDLVHLMRDRSLQSPVKQSAMKPGNDSRRPNRKGKQRQVVFVTPSNSSIKEESSAENVVPQPQVGVAGSSRQRVSRQRRPEAMAPLADMNGLMEMEPVRWFHDATGALVRDGSLPPDYYYAARFKAVQPPRFDPARLPPVPESQKIRRTDTEPLSDDESLQRAQPVKCEPEPEPESEEEEVVPPPKPLPRRSARIAAKRA